MRAAMLSPSLLYLHPTYSAVSLTVKLAGAAAMWASLPGTAWADGVDEAVRLSTELLLPAHDGTSRVGAKVRVMHADCWLHERTALSRLRSGGGWGSRSSYTQRPAALLPGRDAPEDGASSPASSSGRPARGAACRQRTALEHFHKGKELGACWSVGFGSLAPLWTLERTRVDPFMGHTVHLADTKALVLQTRCKRVGGAGVADVEAAGGVAGAREYGGPRPLNLLVPPSSSATWPINCHAQPRVCEVVKRVHKKRAVMAAVSNRNILQMLGQFVETVQRAGVANFLVVALDQQTVQTAHASNSGQEQPSRSPWQRLNEPQCLPTTLFYPSPLFYRALDSWDVLSRRAGNLSQGAQCRALRARAALPLRLYRQPRDLWAVSPLPFALPHARPGSVPAMSA